VVIVVATVSSSLRSSLIEAHRLKARSLADYLSPALVFNDREAIASYLDSLSDSAGVQSAKVHRTGDDTQTMTYRQADADRLIDEQWLLLQPKPISISQSISYRGQTLGRLDMLVSTSQVVRETAAITSTVCISLVLIMSLVSLGLGRLNSSISTPLKKLSQLMTHVSDSADYSLRAQNSDISEVDQLSTGFNNLMRQISDRERRITRLANFDSLTGLRNRRGFMLQLETELNIARREGKGMMLMYIDVDGFKGVNDSLGHEVGDAVLIEAARRITGVLRASDTVSRMANSENELQAARLGGDEFTALLPRIGKSEVAFGAADRICVALRQPYEIDDHSIRVSCSVGVAVFPRDGASATALIQHADSAMYHAKESGRDQVRYYDDELTRIAQRKLFITSRLRSAIDATPGAEEFRLEYQPIVSTSDGTIEGVEALVRWEIGGGESLSPAEFIPIAETTGLIVPLGAWILNRACTQVAMLMDHFGGHLRLAVNISPAQVHQNDFVDIVRQALETSGLPPQCLELEITEAVLIKGAKKAARQLDEIASLGVRIALDDFGTGYSSMSYIKSLPITTLKIDQSFVSGLPGDKGDMAIVKAILAMCQALDLKATAEGVANDEQRDLLTKLGCDSLQGFFYSPAVSIQKIPALCSRYRQRKSAI
tara:strand:+ start:1187 stop:3160 length:1974 start_codon:yes stop_codon:yes gene_type:complete